MDNTIQNSFGETKEYIISKFSVTRVILIVLFFIILFIVTRIKFTVGEIGKNWESLKCKFPYSVFGGYLAPNGIRGDGLNKDVLFYGMQGSKIHFDRCHKSIYDAIVAAKLAPVYASYGNDMDQINSNTKNLSMYLRVIQEVRKIIGNALKKILKIVFVVYYILIYVFQKIKMIMFKIQGVIDVILDSFKTYLKFINYLIFTILPLTLKWSIMSFSVGMSHLLLSLFKTATSTTSAGIKSGGAVIKQILKTLLKSSVAGPSTIAITAMSSASVYLLFAWVFSSIKGYVQEFTQFNGIGKLPLNIFADELFFDNTYDPITGASKQTYNSHSAGSILNILSVITVALSETNDTSECLLKDTKIKLKNKIVNVQDLKPGDEQEDSSIIRGIMKYKSSFINVYDYKGIKMTGSHYIYDKGEYIKCKDIGIAESINMEELYCPITSSGDIICVNESTSETIILADYNDSKSYSEWNYETDKKLGNKYLKTREDYLEHNYPALFATDKIFNNENNIGELIYKNHPEVKLYDYKGSIMSGNVLVYEDTWKRIWQTNAKHVDGKNYKYLYNVLTKNHSIKINGTIYKDYEELDI